MLYVIPGYVSYYEENGNIFVFSQLKETLVKLTDPAVQCEFNDIAQHGGCFDLSTQLKLFLHEQNLLLTEQEVDRELDSVRSLIENIFLITILPTEKCNFRCAYCYEKHASADMTPDMMKKIQSYVENEISHFKILQVNWFGGEPTLCRDMVINASRFFYMLSKEYNVKYDSTITTNGYLLDVDLFRQLSDVGVSGYQITIDGRNHDKLRPHVSGKGTLRRIIEQLKSISKLPKEKYRFSIVLRHNILADDEDYGWYDYLYELFGSDNRFSVLVRPVGDWGGDCVHSLDLVQEGDVESLLLKHVQYIKQIGFNCDNCRKDILGKSCYAHYPHSFVFRSNGTIEKCTVTLDHPKNLIGHVSSNRGVTVNEKSNKSWTYPGVESKCYTCKNILQCFNMRCRKEVIIDGLPDILCGDRLFDVY